jgi:hypothetical protein
MLVPSGSVRIKGARGIRRDQKYNKKMIEKALATPYVKI